MTIMWLNDLQEKSTELHFLIKTKIDMVNGNMTMFQFSLYRSALTL